jgi:putative lipoic acid-binding regulatory protein
LTGSQDTLSGIHTQTLAVDYLPATDDRDVKPNAITTSGRKQVRAYFTSLGGLTGSANSDYQDLLVLSTYSDGTGGDVNALAFDKSTQNIYHYLADQSATTWGTPKRIAYIENGSNNRVMTATDSSTVNGESNLTFTGSLLTNTGDIKIASGSLGVNTNANGSNGRISATSHIEAGVGSGAIGLTINDGGGNSNVTFNHTGRVPEQNGNSGRIEVNTDGTGGEYMAFEIKGNVTAGVAVSTVEQFRIASSGAVLPATKKLYLDGGSDTYITETSADNLKFYVGGVNLLSMIEGGTNVIKAGDGTYLGVGDSTDFYMHHSTNSFMTNGTGRLEIRNQAQDQDIRFSVNDGGSTNNILTLNAASSRVGIGTTAPQKKLHVSTGDTSIAARFENTTSNGTVMELLASGDSTTMYFQTDHIYSSSNLYLGAGNKITHYRGSDHRFQTGTGNNERFRVDANRSTIFGTGANGLVMDNDQGSTGNSNRIFFEGTSTSAIFQSGTALSFRTGATSGSSSGTQQMYINSSGAQFTNNVNVDGHITLQSGHYITAHNESNAGKFRMYGGSSLYAIGMVSGISYGGLNDWSMTFQFNDEADRGFVFRDSAHTNSQGAMAITTNGKATIAHSLRVGYGESDTTTPGGTSTLEVAGNVDLRSDDADAARFLHLPRSGGITFYGDASQHHGIFSRNDSNTNNQDDILITSYGAVYIDLDSNNNNTSEASFEIGRHNTANDPFFKIDGETGRVGISESSIDAMLHINPGNALCNIKLERQGVVAWRFGINTSSADLRFDAGSDTLSGPEVLFTSSGAGHFDNDVVAFSSSTSSDRRLKENIKPIPYGLETVLKMNPVEYDWKEKRDKAHDIGVIAQEVEELIPEIVKEHKDLKTDEPIKTVDYGKMVSVLIKAVQEQQEQINELKEKLNG